MVSNESSKCQGGEEVRFILSNHRYARTEEGHTKVGNIPDGRDLSLKQLESIWEHRRIN